MTASSAPVQPSWLPAVQRTTSALPCLFVLGREPVTAWAAVGPGAWRTEQCMASLRLSRSFAKRVRKADGKDSPDRQRSADR
ncbi:hypothetical protein SUDANB66_06515 (plasmid) [Streptomyces sp. SudanB66_2053]